MKKLLFILFCQIILSNWLSAQTTNPYTEGTTEYLLYGYYMACTEDSCLKYQTEVANLYDNEPVHTIVVDILYNYFLSIGAYYDNDIVLAGILAWQCDSLLEKYGNRKNSFWNTEESKYFKGMPKLDNNKAKIVDWVKKTKSIMAAGGISCPQCPTFPIPPPAASATQVLSSNLFKGSTTLGQVSNKISDILQQQDYPHSYYALSNNSGFAIVAQIEQMNPQTAQSADPRWDLKLPKLRSFSDYFKSLFYTREGYYRIIVFVVSNQPFSQNPNAKIKKEEAVAWLKSGLNTLPIEIARHRWTKNYQVTALIYEFKASENSPLQPIIPSTHTVKRHLEAAKLYDLLK